MTDRSVGVGSSLSRGLCFDVLRIDLRAALGFLVKSLRRDRLAVFEVTKPSCVSDDSSGGKAVCLIARLDSKV